MEDDKDEVRFGIRSRSQSVAEVEVKMLLSNLNAVTSAASSDSEAESSELELEFDQIRGQIRRASGRIPKRNISKDKKASVPSSTLQRRLSLRESKSSVIVGSKEWWDKMKDSLEKQAEQSNLFSDDSKSSPSLSSSLPFSSPSFRDNRGKRKSWLEARESIAKQLEEEANKQNLLDSKQSKNLPVFSSSSPNLPSQKSSSSKTFHPIDDLVEMQRKQSTKNAKIVSKSVSVDNQSLFKSFDKLRVSNILESAPLSEMEEEEEDDDNSSTTSAPSSSTNQWWDDLKKQLDSSNSSLSNSKSNSFREDSSLPSSSTVLPVESSNKNKKNDIQSPPNSSSSLPAPLSPSAISTPAVPISSSSSSLLLSSSSNNLIPSSSHHSFQRQEEEELEEEEEEEEEEGGGMGSWWNDMKKELEGGKEEGGEGEGKEEGGMPSAITSTKDQQSTTRSSNTGISMQGEKEKTKVLEMDSKIQINLPERAFSNQQVVSLPPQKSSSSRYSRNMKSNWTPSSSDNDVNEFSSSKSSPYFPSSHSFPSSSSFPSDSSSLQPTKRGILRFDNGVYRGEIIVTPDSYSLAHGNGTFTLSGGETYIGQWKLGKRDGKGIKIWEDGREYSGEWSSNRRSGHGILTWKNGDVYIGELVLGFQQGWGMLKSNGDKYIGEWNVNERHGYGSMHFKNGDLYSGDWQHNKKHGHGIYRFSDGKSVEGEWIDGVFKTQSGRSKKGDEESHVEEVEPSKKLNLKEVMGKSKSKKESKGGSLKVTSSKTRERKPSTESATSRESAGSPSKKDLKDKIWRKRASSVEITKTENQNSIDSPVAIENEVFGESSDLPSSPSNREERKKKKLWNFKTSST